MDGLECKLQAVVAEFKSIIRETEPRDLKKGVLTRLKAIGDRLLRDIEAELGTVKKLQTISSDDDDNSDSDNESLGGEEYRPIRAT
jgi:hypothetical protein